MLKPWLAIALSVSLLTAGGPASASPSDADQDATQDDSPTPTPEGEPDVPESDRDSLLGPDWQSSDDQIWTSVGDQFGFRILQANRSEGYTWHTITTLTVPGVETDRWVGNWCVTGDQSTMAVVYAPRAFTNNDDLFSRGAFGALIDLQSRDVTYMEKGFSLAHFNPGCGPGSRAAFSSFAEGGAATRVLSVEDSAPLTDSLIEIPTQVTSIVPSIEGLVGAVGGSIAAIASDGSLSDVVPTVGTASGIHTDDNGGLSFVDIEDEVSSAKYVDDISSDASAAVTLATAPVGDLKLDQSSGGDVFITGNPDNILPTFPASVQVAGTPVGSTISSAGELSLVDTQTFPSAGSGSSAGGPHSEQSVGIEAKVLESGADVQFVVGSDPAASTIAVSPTSESGPSSLSIYGPGSSNDPVEGERACAVPRNDPLNQALQPKPRQVEWAVDQAISGDLTITRPANWKNLGMPAYSPQGLFPKPTLLGGGQVPAQVMLGVLAQESNLWQASAYTTPGVTGNPLIGNFYGNNRYADESAFWSVDFQDADCGYGVSQVTDGMRLAGRERSGETALPYDSQRAIALDFAAIVAKGLRMLGDKWNETRAAGVTINDGNSASIENWFAAVWAYNTGFHAPNGSGQPWGLGWSNNPANPVFDQTRHPFLDGSPSDAAHPQDWPYPEKVMGFAAHSVELFEDAETAVPGFRPASWNASDGHDGIVNRATVKPPLNTFCTLANDCHPGALQQPDDVDQPGPCLYHDAVEGYNLKCWFHGNATWKDCGADDACGYETVRFDPGWAEQSDATSFLPNCSLAGLPAGALIIDDLPSGQPSARPDPCPSPISSSGTFGFNFADDGSGNYPSKMDLHQLGAGFNSHFFFAHTRAPEFADYFYGGKLNITGTWTLNQSLNQWARVMVHVPDHGAWTQQASYDIALGNGTVKTRSILQRTYANSWISLGVFPIDGVPSVTLSNVTHDGVGIDDVAWDSVAFVPLSSKPADIVVAMGDSFSSGEGASPADGSNYFRDSDNNGRDLQFTNACHRSKSAWALKAHLASSPSSSLAQRVAAWDPQLDFNFIACSGAETENVLPLYNYTTPDVPTNALGEKNKGQWGQLSQLDRGFLDENTTLVTLSIGGNDARFADIIKQCLETSATGGSLCKNSALAGDNQPLETSTIARTHTEVPTSVGTVLAQIREKAPNATILLMGYPALFETGSLCIGIADSDRAWLNTVATDLNNGLQAAATAANTSGAPVVFANPTAAFSGKNLCTSPSAINGLVFTLSPGDQVIFDVPTPGPNFGFNVSQQSIHPNELGTDLYASVMESTLTGVYP